MARVYRSKHSTGRMQRARLYAVSTWPTYEKVIGFEPYKLYALYTSYIHFITSPRDPVGPREGRWTGADRRI